MTFDDWFPPNRFELSYEKAIKTLMRNIYKKISGKEYDNPFDLMNDVNRLFTADAFREASYLIASNMITGLAAKNTQTWKKFASESMRSKEMYEMLRRQITETQLGYKIDSMISDNALLISSLPEKVRQAASLFIKEESYKGRRAKSIAKDLKDQFPTVSDSRIELIARTESSKAWTDLTQARSRNLGLDWYIWRITKDVRVRDSHKNLNGVICNWNDPPSPEALNNEKWTYGNYHPGKIFNCRCATQPIANLNHIQFPARVHYLGNIMRMTRHEFEKLFISERMAA